MVLGSVFVRRQSGQRFTTRNAVPSTTTGSPQIAFERREDVFLLLSASIGEAQAMLAGSGPREPGALKES